MSKLLESFSSTVTIISINIIKIAFIINAPDEESKKTTENTY